jgi:hypothetical protein
MFSLDDPYPFDDELKDFNEQCRRARGLIDQIEVDPPGDLSVYLDAILALVEVTFQGAELASEAVEDVCSGQLTRGEFIQRLFRLDFTLQLPCYDDLTLPARLVKLLNENRFLTLSDRAPLEWELNESALWELLRLNERLHSVWEWILESFAWPKWADRVPAELQPSEPPELPGAFEIYFRLPADTKPGKSFANKWREVALCWHCVKEPSPPDDYPARLWELRQEIQAVRRALAAQHDGPVEDASEALPDGAVMPNEKTSAPESAGTVGPAAEADRPSTIAALRDTAVKEYAGTADSFWLAAGPDTGGGLRVDRCERNDPAAGSIRNGVMLLPFGCFRPLGGVNLGDQGRYKQLSFSLGGGEELERFHEFARQAGAALVAAPPAWFEMKAASDPVTAWVALLFFASPAAGCVSKRDGGGLLITAPWAASLFALRAWADAAPEPPSEATGDCSAYSPAKDFLDADRFPTFKALRTFLTKHPEIRTRKPSPQRLEIHAGDWMRHFRGKDGAAFDALDTSPEAVEAFLAESKARREEILCRKAGK